MKNLILLTDADVQQAIVAYVADKCGVTVEPVKVTLKLDYNGTFEDREAFPAGAEVELPLPEDDDAKST